MATGKVDRQQVSARLRTTKAEGAAPATKVEETKAQEPESIFGKRSKALDGVKGPEGDAVSKTASANALWGEAAARSANPPLSALTLKNLTPEQAKAKMGELKEKCHHLEKRIEGRADELDGRWKYMHLKTRTEALKNYLASSQSIPAETRTELEAAISKSESAQSQIDALREKAQTLGPARRKNSGTPEERKALCQQILAARKEHSSAVKEATEAVDAAGLRIERLALTEAVIDPSGGSNSKFGSMIGLIGQYFEVSFMMSTLDRLFFMPVLALRHELDRQAKESEKRKVIEEHWRERDDLMRRMVKDLAAKHEVAGRRLEAVRTRSIGKMSVNEAAKLKKTTKAE